MTHALALYAHAFILDDNATKGDWMMRTLLAIVSILGLSACGMTDTQKKWTGIAAGVLVVGAIAAHEADSGKAGQPNDHVHTPSVQCSPGVCD